MKILVIKFMHIGDVLLITPLLKNLAHYYKNSEIDVALNSGTEQMIYDNPSVNRVYIYQRELIRKQPLIKRLKMEIDFLREIKERRYDLVINLTSGDRGVFLSIFSNPKKIVSFPSKKKYLNRFISNKIEEPINFKHWVDINLLALKSLDKKPITKKVEIFWSSEVESFIKDKLKKSGVEKKRFIHFHPLSRWFFKCIDDKLSAEIIDFIQFKLNLRVVLTSSPEKNELQKIDSILKLSKSQPINLAGKLSLKEVSALNKQALAFIGVDTAIMHISASNDIPTLAFFGATIPFAWAPWDNSLMKSSYFAYKGEQRMGKHKIIQKSWECVPCDKKGCKDSGKSDCLLEFDKDEVLYKIAEFIKGA